MSSHAPFGAVERALAWRYVRARREHGGLSVIAVLCFAGISLSVFALIVIMSIMAGFRATLLDALLGGQPHVIASVQERPAGEVDYLVDRILEVDGVTFAAPFLEDQVLVTTAFGTSSGALVKSITQDELTAFDFLQEAGDTAIEAGFGEGRGGGDVIMIGRFLARDLGVREGDEVRLISPQVNSTVMGGTPRNKTYTIGAIFETGSVELDKIYIFMPVEQGQIFFQRRDGYEFIDIRISDPMNPLAAQRRIDEALGGSVYLFNWQDLRGAYFNALNIERNMMRIIMMILVSITAMIIIIGVFMLVKNKKRDIAILRTIGATRGQIMRVFIMIGASLGLIGALIGLSLGVLFVINIPNIEAFFAQFGIYLFDPDTYGLEGLPYRLSALEVIGSAVWAVLMSILVTLWPAWDGASTDPVEALRFE